MNNFAAGIAHLGEAHAVDEVYHFLQCRLHHRLAAADHGEAQHRALPEILVAAFADRNVEFIRDPRLNALDDAALALERVILGQDQTEFENPHDHGPPRCWKCF